MASIEKRIRRDGTPAWRVRFRMTPDSNPVSETFSTAEAATRFLNTVEKVGPVAARLLRDNTASYVSGMTVRGALEDYLAHIGTSATPGTVAHYRRLAGRSWLPAFEVLPVEALTREMVEDWVARARVTPGARSGRPPSPKSLRDQQGLLSSVLALQVERGVIDTNPAAGVKLPRASRTHTQRFITVEEFTRLYEQVPEQWQPLVMLLFSTGLRWGEATALTREDFAFEPSGSVTVSKAWKQGAGSTRVLGAPKTVKAYRRVSLPSECVRVVRPVVEATARGGLVFASVKDQGKPVGNAFFHTRVWGPACERAGLVPRPRVHDLRHSHVAVLIAAGVVVAGGASPAWS